jgi:hypothetical protein
MRPLLILFYLVSRVGWIVSHTSTHLQAETEVQIKEVDREEGEFGRRGHRVEQDEGGVRMGFLAMVIPSSISSKGVITSC